MTSSNPLSSAADLIPPAEHSDPEDVALALETAQALGNRGDLREALRWLRRASEAADDAGRDARALALARTAADLANRLASAAPPAAQAASGSLPPPAAEPENAEGFSSLRPPPPSAARRPSMPSPPSKRSLAPAPPSVPPPAPSVTPPPPSVAPRAPSAEARPSKPAGSLAPSPTRTVGRSIAPEPKRPQAPRSVAPPPTAPSVAPPAVAKPPNPTITTPQALLGSEGHEAVQRLIRQGRAETVSVKRSARDPSLYVVRTGTAERIDTRRALLILLEEDAEFFSDAQPELTN